MGRAAFSVFEGSQGATQFTVDHIAAILGGGNGEMSEVSSTHPRPRNRMASGVFYTLSKPW